METAKERAAREAVLPPHVGRISVHKDAIHFKADMFGLDSTECTLMRWHVKRAEERSATYAVVLVDWTAPRTSSSSTAPPGSSTASSSTPGSSRRRPRA